MARTGKVIIAKNIKLDKQYTHVLNYTESQMLSLVSENAVASGENFSFLKVGENIIDTGFTYEEGLKANYIAFQNPSYSNKWFFGFIDRVEYMSNGNSRIHYTIDEHSTWFDYWDTKYCFVIREHVNSDNYFEHLIDEGLNLGEYVNAFKSTFTDIGTSHVVMATTVNPSDPGDKDNKHSVGGNVYGGVYSGTSYYVFSGTQELINTLNRIAGAGLSDGINGLFIAPDWLTGYNSGTFDDKGIKEVNQTYVQTSGGGILVPLRPQNLAGYVPKNKKLYSYPYCAYVLDNNSGGSIELKLENFEDSGNHLGEIDIVGTITPGCSIRAIPQNYLKASTFASGNENEFGLTLGKFPICSFNVDMYTNWLTQNSVNISMDLIKGTAGAVMGGARVIAGDPTGLGGAVSGVESLISTINSIDRARLIPDSVRGNTNSGDVTYATGQLTFTGYFKCLKPEFLKVIDDYLTKYGYKVNRLKMPNTTGRPYYNYLQIGQDDAIGYSTNTNRSVPAESMTTINDIYRKGTTIWHSHVHIGNYALDNSI